MQQMIFIADLIARSARFGHHYAHHQELESITGYNAAAARKPDTQPSAPHHTDNLKTKAPNTTGSNQLYNTLELLMMGIMVTKTCWTSNNICNKNHLLHLVGILFPHINDDARSRPHQMLQNVGIYLPIDTTYHPTRLKIFANYCTWNAKQLNLTVPNSCWLLY